MTPERFVLLPREGVHASSPESSQLLAQLPFASSLKPAIDVTMMIGPHFEIRLIDTVQPGGPQLVEMNSQAAAALNGLGAPVRMVPLAVYEIPEPSSTPSSNILGASSGPGSTGFTIQCLEAGSGKPLPDVLIFATGGGASSSSTTDANGQASLSISGQRLDLFAYTRPSHWGAFRRDMQINHGDVVPIEIEPVVLPYRDIIAKYYGKSDFRPEVGVTVGVVDTGVGPHSHLNVVGATNTVTGESSHRVEDWRNHGTHVAGVIGATAPQSGTGMRGLAPGIPIRSYRVFGQTGGGATNYSVLKAMILAAAHGCDIVNLSLGGGPHDLVVEEAIRDARDAGMLVIIAAGNDCRKPVSYPAAYAGATAVSAMGAVSCFPTGSLCEHDIDRPPYSVVAAEEFIGRFSNTGPQIKVVAPGVGVLSTLPKDQFGVYSGTSMAAPVVAGGAACILSKNPHVYAMPRNRSRSDTLEMMVHQACVKHGFGSPFEGFGMLDPALIGQP
jgi:hypothetical protein